MTVVALVASRCPDCGAPLATRTFTETALFVAAGHGAARRTTQRFCACGWVLCASVDEINPREFR